MLGQWRSIFYKTTNCLSISRSHMCFDLYAIEKNSIRVTVRGITGNAEAKLRT